MIAIAFFFGWFNFDLLFMVGESGCFQAMEFLF
jgi:hypothetical protein